MYRFELVKFMEWGSVSTYPMRYVRITSDTRGMDRWNSNRQNLIDQKIFVAVQHTSSKKAKERSNSGIGKRLVPIRLV